MKKNLIGLAKEEISQEMELIGEKKFRAKQIWHWIYNRGAKDIEEMHNLPKSFRENFAKYYHISRPIITRDHKSIDGTRKWLLKFEDNNEAEAVLIPEEERGTLCVSSQVGCTLNCSFCHTGTQRLVRNLDASEIVMQMMVARDMVGEWPSPSEGRLVSNIVMMGMGEPLYNYDNVAKALKIIMDGEGISLSKRRITLSTSGVVPMIRQCGEELGVSLAISLHAVRDDLRNELVPLNKKYPIAELLQACREYPALRNSRRITFEYVMLKGVNDSDEDARELVYLIKGIPAKVNLIPFNPWPGAIYECSSWSRIEKFAEIIMDAGYASPVRTPRGRDILAACGQLRSDSIKKSKAELRREETSDAPMANPNG